MFELKYKITDDDMKAVNKSLMWQFFIPYVVVAILGIGAGIAATTLAARTEMLILGILLIVLASILLACAVLMAIAPKNFVASALLTGDNERTLLFGEDGITIKTPEQSDISVGYHEIFKIKDKKTYALLYVDKDSALIVKDAITSGGTFKELVEFIKNKVSPKAPQQTPVAETENNTIDPNDEVEEEVKEEHEAAEQEVEVTEEKAEEHSVEENPD